MRAHLNLYTLLAGFVLLAACQNQSNLVDQAAKQFINAYYVNSDVKNAIKQTAGAAYKQLSKELISIEAENVSSDQVEKPKFDVTMVSSQKTGETTATAVWKVDAVNFKTIYVHMNLEKQSTGFWKVVSFTEKNNKPNS